ncbi:MAG TPA: hypothetical protein VNS63_18300 [Blastocatellia bacterium]|nr:hypothetical protein [Blastocatellia bacterium]
MSQEEIRFDRHFIAVWRAKWLIILVVLLASGATWWLARRQPALLTATALVKIGRVWKEPLEDPYVTEAAVNSPGFFQELAAKLGSNPSHLRRRVRSEVVIGGTRKVRYPILVSVAATAESADEAVRLAQAVSNEIITRHQKLFDDALSPYREREKLIEAQLKESTGSRELQSKLELELNEVKSNNSSPTVTDPTRLVEPIVAEPAPRPGSLRTVATAALISGVACVALAVLAGHFKATP